LFSGIGPHASSKIQFLKPKIMAISLGRLPKQWAVDEVYVIFVDSGWRSTNDAGSREGEGFTDFTP
jgi:hypothetical protein